MRSTASPTDEELMERYARGDEGAIVVLLPRFAGKLWGFFARSFRDRSVADDLYQTTLLKLHHARGSYRPPHPFRPWLFAIAARVRADELRRRYRSEKEAGAAVRGGVVPRAAADPEDDDRDRRVREALGRLPDSQREVVMLHRYAGLTFAEIADVLAEREGERPAEVAVRARAFRAYETLRKSLSELGGSE